MTRCKNCKAKIVKHEWIVNEIVYCSPVCERGKESRYSDKMVKRLGVAGFVKENKSVRKR